MPWFSKKKKRKTKAAVVNISRDDSAVSTTRPVFTVVLQGYEASVEGELSIERGQVLESLYSHGNWIYVRNVDGHCGYVPCNYCFPLEKLRIVPSKQKSNAGPQIRAHPRPTTIHVDNFEREREGEEEEVAEGEEGEEVNSPDSGISCSQPASSNTESVPSFHTSSEGARGVVGRSKRAGHTARQESYQQAVLEVESSAGHTQSHTHFASHPSDRHKRHLNHSALPLLETASPQHCSRGQLEVPPSRHLSPSPPPLPPVNLAELRKHKELSAHAASQLSMACAAVTEKEGEERRSNRSSASDADDVFLPDSGKPVGIYQSMETYEAKFQGELSLQKDEVVVVMEVGRGEWVWAVGCDQKEGLVPKELLHKYRPDEEESREEEEVEEGGEEERGSSGGGGVNVCVFCERMRRREEDIACDIATSSTQTELVIDGIVREITSSSHRRQDLTDGQPQRHCQHSEASAGERVCECAAAGPTTPPRVAMETVCVAIQTEFTSPDWFKNTTPTPTPSSTPHHTLTKSTSTVTSCRSTLLASQTPSTNSATPSVSATPRNSLPAPPPSSANTPSGQYLPLVPAITPQKPSICVQSPGGSGVQTLLNTSATGRTGTIHRHKQALRQHTRIVNSIRFQPENEASGVSPAIKRRVQPTPIITAIKDYTPSPQAKNGLAIRRGDIMYAQPHVPFPHGWLWVYHTILKKYGYVPKGHIAYMYLVQKKPSTRGTIVEDEV